MANGHSIEEKDAQALVAWRALANAMGITEPYQLNDILSNMRRRNERLESELDTAMRQIGSLRLCVSEMAAVQRRERDSLVKRLALLDIKRNGLVEECSELRLVVSKAKAALMAVGNESRRQDWSVKTQADFDSVLAAIEDVGLLGEMP